MGAKLSNGKYVVEGFLSSGGFGNTYVATDTSFDERVAIKELYIKGVCGRMEGGCTISVSLTENQRTFAAQQEKFKKEARRLRKLSNPHIIRVHDLFDENGTSYYVMELVDGESLSQRIKRTKQPLTEQELMLILPQVLDALQTVHAEGIWHLDLKPANIMLDRRGNAVLIDFGASKQLKNKDGEALSTSSALAYTQGYAPSEQMEQNIDKFGPWTDLYALGATMYNLLTLNVPPSPSDIEEDADEALPLPKEVSKKTRDLILWLMKPNRKMRPQSVTDVKQFLLETADQPMQEPLSKHKKTQKPDDPDETELKQKHHAPTQQPAKPATGGKGKGLAYAKYAVMAAMVVGIGIGAATLGRSCSESGQLAEVVDSDSVVVMPAMETQQTQQVQPAQTAGTTTTRDPILAQIDRGMVYVEGGTFVMGGTSEQGGEAYDDEKPTHSVTLSSYYLSDHEVTQAEWEAVMGSNSSYFKGGNLPVQSVSWEDCQEFIRKLNILTGLRYRLPTEAEWEYAARGGSKSRGYKYSGSNTLGDVAWYRDNSGSKTHSVKSKQSNELGLYDMSGNIWEWCQDGCGSYSSSSQSNPQGDANSIREIRGGSWDCSARSCRVSNRDVSDQWDRYDGIGLRLAR